MDLGAYIPFNKGNRVRLQGVINYREVTKEYMGEIMENTYYLAYRFGCLKANIIIT